MIYHALERLRDTADAHTFPQIGGDTPIDEVNMNYLKLGTDRLTITQFDMSMAQAVHENSLDEDTRRFVPDEVFETVEDAADTIEFLMSVYETGDGPLVYPAVLHDGTNIGYVQLVPMDSGFEVGYHIAKQYTGKGYATEAVSAFLKHIMPAKGIEEVCGICVSENIASKCVMEKVGFQKVFEGLGTYQGEQRMIAKYVYKSNL